MKDQIFSKVILCGEHSVLRGGMAVVAPFKLHSFKYDIEASNEFILSYSEKVFPYQILFEGTFDKALSILNRKKNDLKVKIKIESMVPLGKGLGGSAAVSIFISRVMNFLSFIKEEGLFSFAMELENMFHGDSSGVDIAGCLSSGPCSYLRGKPIKKIKTNFKNVIFALSDTNEISETEVCIQKVESLKIKNKKLVQSLDISMDKASKNIVKALEENNLELLIISIKSANKIFNQWGLITLQMFEKIKELKNAGALAVKPTGSGMGGYLLSIWKKENEANALKTCSKILTF